MDNENTQPTLRETIQASIETHAEPVVTNDPVETSVAEPAAAESPEQKAGRTAGRARDEQGKLLPGKAQKAVPESPKPEAAPPASEALPATPAAAPVTRPQGCPSSWPKEMWSHWAKMNSDQPLTPQEARQVAEFNAKREGQFATGVSTYKQIADSAKPLMDAIAPFQGDLDKHGIQAPDMVHRLMSAHRSLALGSPQEKLQLLSKLANDYGIPIQALYDQNAQQQFLATPHTPQPQQAAQQQDMPTLIRQEIENSKRLEAITAMANDTQNYPFFNYVRSDMAQLLESLEATDLNDAYAKALELPQHAMLGTALQQQQTQANEQARIAAAQATARVARSNAVSPRSATPAAPQVPDNGKQGVRNALIAAIGQHAGGARV